MGNHENCRIKSRQDNKLRQWEGVKSNGLPTPVFNFLKRVVLFSVANIATDNLKLNAKPMPSSGNVAPEIAEVMTNILNDTFAGNFERNDIAGLLREFARNAAVDGDGCLYTYWDPSVETGQDSKGDVVTEVLRNTQVMFGNPNNRDVQSQPYIIIERRMLIDEARKYARKHGASEEAVASIVADDKQGGDTKMDQLGGAKVTALLYMWRDDETGTIHFYECTNTTELRSEWDGGIKLYPIVWMNWDYVQDCYHGQAMITGLIPNQIFVNKLFALSMISLMTLAYPKIIFDKTKVRAWSAKVGAAIGVNGNVDGVAKILDPASVSPQIYQFIDVAVSYTQKFLGATDVALGDTRPDNTSAIIALQRAAATPMEITHQNFIQCVEDLGRIYMEFNSEYYGERYVEYENITTNQTEVIPFDFSIYKDIPFTIGLDAGASTYWSEIANMQTLDNLLMQNKIPTSEYLRRLPNGQITDRDKLVAIAQAMEQGQAIDMSAIMGNGTGEPEAEPTLRGGAGYGALQRKINQTGEVPRQEV